MNIVLGGKGGQFAPGEASPASPRARLGPQASPPTPTRSPTQTLQAHSHTGGLAADGAHGPGGDPGAGDRTAAGLPPPQAASPGPRQPAPGGLRSRSGRSRGRGRAGGALGIAPKTALATPKRVPKQRKTPAKAQAQAQAKTPAKKEDAREDPKVPRLRRVGPVLRRLVLGRGPEQGLRKAGRTSDGAGGAAAGAEAAGGEGGGEAAEGALRAGAVVAHRVR